MSERLKSAKGGDLLFHLAHCCQGRQGLRNGFAAHLVGQLNLGAVASISGLGTMTIGLAAAAVGAGAWARLEVAEVGNLTRKIASEGALIGSGIGHMERCSTA